MNQEAKVFLMAKVHTVAGVFVGRLTPEPCSYAVAVETRDTTQKNLDKFNYIVLFDGAHIANDTETMLPANVLENSAFEFSFVRAETLGWKPAQVTE
jgi:hypothetical protein